MAVIRFLKHNKIDLNKYDKCIAKAINTHIYAYSWYLNIVADDWSILVMDDYKAVMPIPYLRIKKFFFVKKIVQPEFCQQLGIFMQTKLNAEEYNSFYTIFLSLKAKQYHFNTINSQFLQANIFFIRRINYELELNKPYDIIYSNYSKNLKRNIKKSNKANLIISKDIVDNDFFFQQMKSSKHQLNSYQKRIINKIISEINQRNIGHIYAVKLNDEIIAMALMIIHNGRILHLYSTSNSQGRKKAAISYLFNKLIWEYSGQEMIFDFEGSIVASIAHFYKSFGAKKKIFFAYSK